MGIAASVAVAIAVLVAITLTPALLGFAKGRVVGWKRRAPKRRRASVGEGTDAVADEPAGSDARPAGESALAQRRGDKPRRGFADRWVTGVTRHPIVTTVAVIVGLGVLAIPAASLRLALPNAGMQSTTSEARQAYDLTSQHFGPGFNGPLIMTGTIVTSNDPLGLMKNLAKEIEKVPGVKTIALATPNQTADTGIIQIVPKTAPDDPATAQLVRDLRAQHDRLLHKYGVDLKVTGFTAVAIDISDRLGGALLPFGVFVVGLSLILLTIVFRSIWVPIKAALGYLLSVAAAFGVVSAVFEWGWLAGPLHVDKVGPIISFMPIILMGVLFGLAMDYEVFLVSRMREDFVHARARKGGADNDLAVATVRSGFKASARVVTAAAIIMFAVFAAFVPEGDTSIKPIALGLAVGIAIDAFLVRMTLVPAVMALLGEKAWWMPRWLDRVLPHFDIEGEAVERELALHDWPEPHTSAAVVAEDLALAEDDVELYSGASLRVEPGASLIVTSAEPRSARALLLTIAGRLAPTAGRLRVAGHLLPERSAWVRSHVGVALLDGAADPVAELRRAVRGRAAVVVIDSADALASSPVRDRAAAALRDAGSPAIIVSAEDPDLARALLEEARRPGAALLDLSDSSTVATEVLS
jgi:RND superfamily putative drug exporter